MRQQRITDQEAEVLAEHVRRGGAVICVRDEDALVDKVRAILRSNSSIDLAIRRRSFEQDGWTGFDPAAQPYNAHEVQAERSRHNQR